MDLIRSMHPLARAWLLDGPLSSYIEAFQALLKAARRLPFVPGRTLPTG